MPYLVAAVVLIGAICLLDLVLTIGVIRRLKAQDQTLRSHEARLDSLAMGEPPPMERLAPGAAVGEFTATTTDGETLTRDSLGDLVAFVSPECGACRTLVSELAALPPGRTGGRERVLAVVVAAEPGEASEYVTKLTPVARVVVEDYDGAVGKAFQNTWMPSLYLLAGDHTVAASGGSLGDVPLEAAPSR
ncbi:TlpA family protein disulfide reductase [Bailinhaonella thermotolerans]|uniref:TlpA family protein disulfide reductase n=1 Tax=Bailinhaonella thermotolerans TaxID=1070861 RepID=A0A3A4A7Q8_9ACTN|nr:TlpA family protein disulfide reductase [Bailinhaonella thermotolerans]RJL22047.1 TlpA family protein disulfide reductase [Bailinhaonella thermotolerans]